MRRCVRHYGGGDALDDDADGPPGKRDLDGIGWLTNSTLPVQRGIYVNLSVCGFGFGAKRKFNTLHDLLYHAGYVHSLT